MKKKNILLSGLSIIAGSVAVFGAFKLKKHLDKKEILIQESNFFAFEDDLEKFTGGTLIDLDKQEIPVDVLECITTNNYDKYIIVLHKSATKKLAVLGVTNTYEPTVWNDNAKAKFIIFDGTELNVTDNESVNEIKITEANLTDHSNEEVAPVSENE